jgi:hypothetical protein
MLKKALLLLAPAAILACGGAGTAFTRTGPTVPAQPDGCDFTVVKERPSQPLTELGTVDLKYTSQMDWIYEEAAFKRKVRPLVCQNGGDTVLAHTNDNGLYVKATVLTSKSAQAAPASAPPPETASQSVESVTESPPPPPPAPVAEKPATEKPAEAEAKADDGKKSGKKGSKKGESAKKDSDIHGKDGKIDIDKLL